MNYSRWEIWLAKLDPVTGSEQGKTRPVLVVSRSTFNQVMPIVDVLPITSRKAGRTLYRNEVLIPAGTGGLQNESILMCHQIRALDKQRFIRHLGHLTDIFLQAEIAAALRFQLEL